MKFDMLENENNIIVTLIDENNEIAKAKCYFKNTPIINDCNIGCIGEIDIKDYNYANDLFNKCEEVLRLKNIHFIVAPMNGNTWKKYRAIKYSNGDDMFLLENVDSMENQKILVDNGFNELYTYTSNKGKIMNSYNSEALDFAEKTIQENEILIRKFNKQNSINDLRKIYNVSVKCFSRNPLYVSISEEEFMSQYIPYLDMLDEDLILIAEKDENTIGFLFSIPDFNEIKNGKPNKTLILKTIAILPEYENLALGNVMLRNISKIAINKKFEEWIFAFMYINNTSQKMAKRNNAHIIREYALYGKEI